MPTYLYACRAGHGRVEVTKPMAEAGRAEACPACGQPLARVWAVPSLIVRPWGYHLRPGEKDYWNVNRTAEVSRIPAPDAKSNLGAGAPTDAQLEAEEYAGVALPQPTEAGLQKLHEVARATFGDSGSRL